MTAARTHHLLQALTDNQVMTFADKGYQGAGGIIPPSSPAAVGTSTRGQPCHLRIHGIDERVP
jgi:hypothetical protein